MARMGMSVFGKALMAACVMVGAALPAAVPAMAQEATPRLLGEFKDWTAFTVTERGSQTCYMVSQPTELTPKNVRRGDVYFIVSHRPSQDIEGEINIQTGYPYKPGSTATAKVGGGKYSMFTRGEDAWVDDAKKEDSMLTAMRKNYKMTVAGTSKRGTRTVDTYSLSGFSAALNAISKACKVR